MKSVLKLVALLAFGYVLVMVALVVITGIMDHNASDLHSVNRHTVK
jgi:hypothetical protein